MTMVLNPIRSAERQGQGRQGGAEAGSPAPATEAEPTATPTAEPAPADATGRTPPPTAPTQRDRRSTIDAEDEDAPRRRQALQGHRHRQDPAPQGVPRAPAREEVRRAARAASAARPRSPAATRSASSACSGRQVEHMARVKRSVNGKKHRRAILEEAQGYTRRRAAGTSARPTSRSCTRGSYAYRDRRARKGEFRRLWIVRINAACREHDIVVLALHRRAEGRRDRRRPQDPRRPRGARAGRVRRAGHHRARGARRCLSARRSSPRHARPVTRLRALLRDRAARASRAGVRRRRSARRRRRARPRRAARARCTSAPSADVAFAALVARRRERRRPARAR